MRKKCVSCGLICFESAEFCKRCGSNNLAPFENSTEFSNKKDTNTPKPLTFWNYLTYFFLASLIEFVALIPVLGGMGTKHSSTITHSEINDLIFVFILHLPTILITWLIAQITSPIFEVFTPITQIIFWTFLFSYFARRKRNIKT